MFKKKLGHGRARTMLLLMLREYTVSAIRLQFLEN